MNRIDIVLNAMTGAKTIEKFVTALSNTTFPDGTSYEPQEVVEWIDGSDLGDMFLERRFLMLSGVKLYDEVTELMGRAGDSKIYRWESPDGGYIVLFIENQSSFNEVVASARAWFEPEPDDDEDVD